MGGHGEAARAEPLASVTKRCRAILLAGTAVVAISAHGALTLGSAQAADLNNTGTVDNNVARTQNVATNTGTINNNSGGGWSRGVFAGPGANEHNTAATRRPLAVFSLPRKTRLPFPRSRPQRRWLCGWGG